MQEIVKDVMTKEVLAVLPSDTVEQAAVLMYENDIGSVPVVLDGALKGILTDRDIVVRCIAKGKSTSKAKVSEIMSNDICTLTPKNTLHDAIEIMAKEQIRRVPVVENGMIDGIVSLADIARVNSGPEIALAISEISLPSE